MIVSISGPSKSGKTVLVTKVVAPENLIHIYGASIKIPEDLWLAAPAPAGATVPVRGIDVRAARCLSAAAGATVEAPRTSPGGTGGLPWTHRAEVVADDDAQQEGQAPGPRIVHCLGSCGLTNSSPHARLPIRPRATPGPDTTISHRRNPISHRL
jgi:hypothetical protein